MTNDDEDDVAVHVGKLFKLYETLVALTDEQGLTDGSCMIELAGLIAANVARLNDRPLEEALTRVAVYAAWFEQNTKIMKPWLA